MNILKLQDDLKNFSQQQLVMEMQKPSGNVPQFLVLSELSRRKRMQTDQARAEAANTPTVAQEAVAAAGMPMGGVTQMAQAMAPKTSMTENTGIAAMMPKQPTRMATGGVVKMQEAGSVEEQIQKILEEQRANPNSITNTLRPALIELSLDGSYGKDQQKFAVETAIAGGYGPEIQREVLSKALAGEYGDEIKEGAKRAKGVLEESGLRGFEPEDNQLASAAAKAENVVPEFKSGLRGFAPTDTQLAPTASRAETVAPQFKSGLRGFVPTDNQLAPMGAVAEVVKPAKPPTIQAGAGIRGADTRPAKELAELLGGRQMLPGVDLPGPSTTYEIDPTAALRAGASLNTNTSQTMGMPAMRDPAVIDPRTGQPYDDLGLMRQQAEQARQADAQAAFDRSLPTPDELMVPFNNTKDLFDPQGLNQQRAERDRILANEIAAMNRENNLSTFPVRNQFQDNQPQVLDPFEAAVSEIAGIGSTNFKTATALEAENQNREDSFSTFPIRNQFQDNQPQVGDVDPRSIYNLGPGSTAAANSRGGGSGPVDIPPVESADPIEYFNKTNMPLIQRLRLQGDLPPITYSDDLLPPKLDEEKPAPEQIGDATDAQNIQDVEPLAPEKPELSPEQELLRKLEAKSAASTGALMDFYKDLEKDKKYETAMKMVEFGAELMKPTATIGEGVGKATQAMVKGAKDRKKDYNKNKIAILSLQERIDASKAAALRSEIGLGIQQANLDLRTQLAAGSAAKAAREKATADFETLGGIDRLNALKFAIEGGDATNAEKLEYMRLQSMLDKLIPSGTGAKNIEIQDA